MGYLAIGTIAESAVYFNIQGNTPSSEFDITRIMYSTTGITELVNLEVTCSLNIYSLALLSSRL